MDFSLNEEQLLLQSSARRFFTEHATSAEVRAAATSALGYDATVWARLAGDMGWTAITTPEAYGGLGLGQVELALVMEEMGRTLYPSPYLASVALAQPALLHAGNEAQRQRWLPALAAGECTAALASTGTTGRAGAAHIEASLTPTDGAFTLSGRAGFVVSGHTAEWLLVAAHHPGGGLSLAMVPREAAGVRGFRLETLDLTRAYARFEFDAVTVPAEAVLGTPGQAGPALARTLALANIALAAEQLGGAEQCLHFTVAYAKQRVQFGRAIGSFQAVKHKLADMMVAVEAARSAVYYAACAADEAPALLAEAAAVAKSFCSDTFNHCASEAIQLHGGIGFTWEHDAHLYFKRARASTNLLGDAIHHREQLAAQLLDDDQPLLQMLGGR